MLKPDSNLPEWVQSKITLAEDYILTAANYMEGEMNEEMKPYVKAAQQKFDLEARANRKNTKQAGSAAADYERKKQKEADVALKAIKFAKGKKNKIDMKPQLNGEKDANIQ
jgi:predicted nucleotide-binding protein (sugar kinase/HSP70/actin superfamily)